MAEHSCGCGGACSTSAIHHHTHDHAHDDHHKRVLRAVLFSLAMLLVIALVEYWASWWELSWLRVIAFGVAFLPVGWPVVREAWELLTEEHSFFNESTLMVVASLGAFAIGERYEAVLLMLLFQIGEYLEGRAVHRAKHHISELVDVRNDKVLLVEGDLTREIPAEDAQVGDVLRVPAGTRVSLDGLLLSDVALLDQSALTGESVLVEKEWGEEVLAGSVVTSKPVDIQVAKPYEDSTLARIIQMTEEAAEHKPPTERFIRRFAKVYTPIVFALAALVVVLPWLLLGGDYLLDEWLYRGLVFLVVSCPCALVISVPLSYFCGLGAMSKHGLLVKGAVHLEQLNRVNSVVFDKTGTLTEGSFEVKEVRVAEGFEERVVLANMLALELQSTHPMALAIQRYATDVAPAEVTGVEEVTGMGLKGITATGERLLVGSERLMERHGIATPGLGGQSAVLLAIDDQLAGVVLLADMVKPQSREAVTALGRLGIRRVVMLSGDNPQVVRETATMLGITDARGGLLPDDKMRAIEQLKQDHHVAFVGDGLNDAPVMKVSHVGIAMGGIGSDATIEAADIIIQGDSPFKVPQSIDISRFTHKIVVQNIIFALGFKFAVMLLAVLGFASLTLAIVADVGVTLLAVLNALRALTYQSKV